jgi:hypothetical protein
MQASLAAASAVITVSVGVAAAAPTAGVSPARTALLLGAPPFPGPLARWVSDGRCSGPRLLRPESVHEYRYVALGEFG